MTRCCTIRRACLRTTALTNDEVLHYSACLPPDKRKILYVDTEQSRYHYHKVMERILRLAGLPTDQDRDDFVFIVLREQTPDMRKRIQPAHSYGIRDLMYDINSPSESTDLINLLMRWSSGYNLHIHTVLHLNKGDDNTRGHIGTELNNKAETVLQITKSTQDGNISEVKAMHIRDRDFEPFAFRINDSALPEVVDGYVFQQPKQEKSAAPHGVGKRFRQAHRAGLFQRHTGVEAGLCKHRLRAGTQCPCGTEHVPREQAYDCKGKKGIPLQSRFSLLKTGLV